MIFMKTKKYFMILVLVVSLALPLNLVQSSLGPLQVYFIDVWQGDAALIVSPTGKTILIDAGDNAYGDEVIAFMTSHQITSLDYMLSSHYHADHIGGSDYVLYQLPVGIVYDRGGTYDSQTFWDYVEAAGEKRTTIQVGETIDLGDGLLATIVQSDYGPGENNKSIVLKLSYGTVDFLFGGDCEGACEGSLKVGDIEVYKVHHHGSKTSSSWSFLQQIRPELAVISVGENNSYGHPARQTLENLKNIGAKICRTDKDGDVSVYSDGQAYWYKSEANPNGCATSGGKGRGKK